MKQCSGRNAGITPSHTCPAVGADPLPQGKTLCSPMAKSCTTGWLQAAGALKGELRGSEGGSRTLGWGAQGAAPLPCQLGPGAGKQELCCSGERSRCIIHQPAAWLSSAAIVSSFLLSLPAAGAAAKRPPGPRRRDSPGEGIQGSGMGWGDPSPRVHGAGQDRDA